ncbi:hypothetical protein SAY87_012455 [Trapa incisa]|uniref:Uncharacterized protein n=1 Tax=Trapa incisa TaxID=236973 RepID=A0AAN7GK26_9MYRT|nr:hypothetical protein SAY87_012455 [Trapa incisa]
MSTCRILWRKNDSVKASLSLEEQGEGWGRKLYFFTLHSGFDNCSENARTISFPFGTSIFRWPRVVSTYQGVLQRWPEIDFNFLDEVIWSLVTVLESVALVSMLCFFFLFCGCTV